MKSTDREACVPARTLEAQSAGRRSLPTWLLGIIPLILLAALVAIFFALDPTRSLRAGFPPVEELTINRITLHASPREMVLHVVNGGPEATRVAQVMVDEAYWPFTIQPGPALPRLGRATITLPYPWVEGEPHTVTLITPTGLTFSSEIAVATQTPRPDARYLGTFSLLGVYAGVIPVFLGLLWFPYLRQIEPRWVQFFLSLTVGLLVFLFVDALHEAFETAPLVAGAFQGVGLIGLGGILSLLAIMAAGSRILRRGEQADEAAWRRGLAYMIALGIGLHNLGEGLAIGAAYAIGEIALGAFLIIGFTLHNTTEGLGILAPMAKDRPPLAHLAAMGILAGVPTILGTFVGGFTYSPALATLFLSIGAGAILQVVIELLRLMGKEGPRKVITPLNFAGIAAGMLVMYATGLLVAA